MMEAFIFDSISISILNVLPTKYRIFPKIDKRSCSLLCQCKLYDSGVGKHLIASLDVAIDLFIFHWMVFDFQIFDPALMKKKKKKKPFDLDAALGDSNADNAEKEDATKENDGAANEFDENLDLENFGKKKKKKKNPFNLDKLENNLPAGDVDDGRDEPINDEIGEDGANAENDYDLDLDFSKTKKKKKKKKEFEELVADKTEEQQLVQSENGKICAIYVSILKQCVSI